MLCNKLTETFGIELVDFDVTRPRGPAIQAELRAPFCEHHRRFAAGRSGNGGVAGTMLWGAATLGDLGK